MNCLWLVGALTGLLLMGACSSDNKRNQDGVSEYSIIALGTIVSISVHNAPANFVDEILPDIEARLARDEHRWRSFGDGELGRANDILALGKCATLEAETRQLLTTALNMQRLSDGLFDPALGIEIDQLGFRDTSQTPQLPTQTSVIAPAQLTLTGNQVCTSHAARIDLGGIAKGAIVQRLITVLTDAGVHNAIINAGGDLHVLGARGTQPWRIAIQHPRKAQIVASLTAEPGQAWFTSGDYYRSAQINGSRTHHILDPRTRRPSTDAVAVTVISDDPILSDAAATALMVAGRDSFREIAQRMGISQAILIDADLTIHQWPKRVFDLPGSLDGLAPEDPSGQNGKL